jgi:hypothetical protein
MPTPEPQQQPVNLFGNLTALPFDQFGNLVTPAPAEKTVAQEAPSPAESAVVPKDFRATTASSNLKDPFARRPGKDARSRAFRTTAIPLLMLLLGWAAYSGNVAWAEGLGMLVPAQLGLMLLMGMQAVFSFVVCLLAAPLIGATIGHLGSAFLRIAAIVIFPTAVSLYVPYLGEFVLQPILCWFLLSWFFEIDLIEGFILSQILWVSHFLVFWLLAMWGMMTIVR